MIFYEFLILFATKIVIFSSKNWNFDENWRINFFEFLHQIQMIYDFFYKFLILFAAKIVNFSRNLNFDENSRRTFLKILRQNSNDFSRFFDIFCHKGSQF